MNLREALKITRTADPAAVAAIDAEARAAEEAAIRAAKDRADREAKVAKAVAGRAKVIAAEYAAATEAAVAAAAEQLAEAQLRAEHGLTTPQMIAVGGGPATWLTPEAVDRARKRILADRPVPWHGGMPSAAARVEAQREAAEAVRAQQLAKAPPRDPTLGEQAAAAKVAEAEREARRQADVADRKRAVGIVP